MGSCSFLATAGLAAIGRAITGGLAGLAAGDLATNVFCFAVAAAGDAAELFDSFFDSLLLSAFFPPRITLGGTPLTGEAIFTAVVFTAVVFTADVFTADVFTAVVFTAVVFTAVVFFAS